MKEQSHEMQRVATQGWRQFLMAKKRVIDAYDRAREQAKAHKVETFHGTVAEAEIRLWLSEFLPSRYGVTAGYVVSQGIHDDTRVPHFDVIIYDKLESPVLWVENSSDLSSNGSSRAIPAEYVRAVIEVKSNLNSTTAADATKHLNELLPLASGVDPVTERYKKFLPSSFFCLSMFVNLNKSDQYSAAAIRNLYEMPLVRGYAGALILRGDGLPANFAGRVSLLASETEIPTTLGSDQVSLLSPCPLLGLGLLGDHYIGTTITWHDSVFAMFAFDLLALLNGSFEQGRISSLHGIAWRRPVNR